MREQLLALAYLPDKEMRLVQDAFTWRDLPANHILLREQQVSDYMYFVERGIIRNYYRKQQKEITEWLAMDKQFCLSITSFFQRTPSRLIMHTLEPSVVAGIHYDTLMELCAAHHAIETLLRRMLTGSLILSQQRMDAIQFETTQQRYQKLVQQQPELLQRVPLTYIASFLGMTLETMSRIRSHR